MKPYFRLFFVGFACLFCYMFAIFSYVFVHPGDPVNTVVQCSVAPSRREDSTVRLIWRTARNRTYMGLVGPTWGFFGGAGLVYLIPGRRCFDYCFKTPSSWHQTDQHKKNKKNLRITCLEASQKPDIHATNM